MHEHLKKIVVLALVLCSTQAFAMKEGFDDPMDIDESGDHGALGAAIPKDILTNNKYKRADSEDPGIKQRFLNDAAIAFLHKNGYAPRDIRKKWASKDTMNLYLRAIENFNEVLMLHLKGPKIPSETIRHSFKSRITKIRNGDQATDLTNRTVEGLYVRLLNSYESSPNIYLSLLSPYGEIFLQASVGISERFLEDQKSEKIRETKRHLIREKFLSMLEKFVTLEEVSDDFTGATIIPYRPKSGESEIWLCSPESNTFNEKNKTEEEVLSRTFRICKLNGVTLPTPPMNMFVEKNCLHNFFRLTDTSGEKEKQKK